MKVCEMCGQEISTRDGENRCVGGCRHHEKKTPLLPAQRAKRRKEIDTVMRDLGLQKVRGALGGTYWE